MGNKKRTLKASQQVMRRQKRKKLRRRRAAVLIIEILLLCVLGVSAFGMFKYGKMDLTVLDNIANNGLKQDGYTNVALFGTDNRAGEVEGVRSDCIIVASINNETKEIKLMSIYRDTMLKQEDGYFNKANSAYAMGGPEGAVNMLNRNLDLDIEDYVTVNFLALADVIDLLGGIELDLSAEEVVHMNNYCVETSEITGKDYTRIDPEVAGHYHLNGVQAVSYCRIRYTDGGDFERSHRQRIVIGKIMEKAKSAKLSTLNNIVDAVLPEVSTSFTANEIIKLAASVLDYNLGENIGFPFVTEESGDVPGYTGFYVVPVGLEDNVRQAHAFLFPEIEYEPTETLKTLSQELCEVTQVYPEGDEQVEDESVESVDISEEMTDEEY